MSQKLTFSLILITLGVILLETVSFLVGRYVIPDHLLFAPRFNETQKEFLPSWYERYLTFREPVTGWPLSNKIEIEGIGKDSDEEEKIERDSIGARVSPNFPDPQQHEACISLYGDSFTFAAEVANADAWGNLLAAKLNCRVNNFGVGGFGSDQAYLKYITNQSDDAPVVFLNHLSENIVRNSSQFRSLLIGYDVANTVFSFKPRFIIGDDDELELVGMPQLTGEEYIDLLYYPENYLQHDFFIPGGPSGMNRQSFPYTWSLVNVIRHFHVQMWLEGLPWYIQFYEPDHVSNGLEVTTAIMKGFHDAAIERGQVPVLTVIPTGQDLLYFNEYGRWPYENLLSQLEQQNIEALNFGAAILEHLDGADPCSLFDNCSAHFNEEGYAYLAEIAYAELARRELLPPR
jgi:hypothetical protein